MKNIGAAVAAFTASVFLAVAPSYAITAKEIKDKGKIAIGVMTDYVPYGFIDENNKNQGYDVDVARLVGKSLGIEVELVPVSGANRIPFLQTKKVDLIVAALGITEERAKQVLFSKSYSGQVTVIYGKREIPMKDYADLVGLTISVERGTTPDTVVTANMLPGTNLQRYGDGASTVQAIASGQVDAGAISALSIPQLVKRDPAFDDRFEVKFELTRLPQGMAATLDSGDLIDAVNAAIDEMTKSGELNEIHKKWIGSEYRDYGAAAAKP
jgi:polar amino acid transport system substrate-binding protein